MNISLKSLGIAALCLGVGWFLGREVSSGSAVRAASPVGAAVTSHRGHGGAPPTLLELLVQRAGDRAPELAQKAAAEGHNLGAPVDPGELPDWQTVEQEALDAVLVQHDTDSRVVRDIGWAGGRLTADMVFNESEFNPTSGSIAPEQVTALRELCRPFDDALLRLSEEKEVLAEQALRAKWANGGFEAVPFVWTPHVEVGGGQVYETRCAYVKNWAIAIELRVGDLEAYDTVSERIAVTRSARADAVRKAIGRYLDLR